jgi:hypothetical protein
MKVKELITKFCEDDCPKFSIHYERPNEEGFEIIIETEFKEAVMDLFGEREICEEDSIWFEEKTLNLWVQ